MRETRRRLPNRLTRIAIAFLTVATRARADEQPIDLAYRAPDTCPSERQFVEMVVGRAAKTLVLSERARGRKFVVTVTQQRKETSGRLEIVTGGTTAARDVSGANCNEVVSALALFTALAIDPSASVEPTPEPKREEPRPPEPKPPAPPITIVPPIEQETHPPPRERRAHGSQILVGARALGVGAFQGGAPTPSNLAGAGLFAQLTTEGFGAYRAGGTYFANSRQAGASFRFFSGRLDGCPISEEVARSLTFEPCLALEVGRVSATSQAAPALAPSTEARWWVAGDLVARGRFAPISWIFTEVEVGASVPFTRYTFLLGRPGDVRGEVHRVPAVGWVLGLGAGARIW
jgi:hypothetical protein